MSKPTQSAIPSNKLRKSNEAMVAELLRELRIRECGKCHYAVDADRICSNLDCPAWRDVGTHIELYHGRRWGRWAFDLERYCLVFDGKPAVLGPDFQPYVAFLGSYECDLERMCTPARLLDFIFQVRGSIWGIKGGIQDLVNALDDILYPQSSLCSYGIGKTISNPREFLQHRVATVGKEGAA
jgi:hypothetical protein